MNVFRQYIAPALIVLVFLLAFLATSARIFLPDGLSGPAQTTLEQDIDANSNPS